MDSSCCGTWLHVHSADHMQLLKRCCGWELTTQTTAARDPILAPLECSRDQLCVQSKGIFSWWPHAQAYSMYLPAEAVLINASSLHPICYIYFSLEAPALYLVVII